MKITDKVKLLLNRHNDPDATAKALEQWTAERRDFLLSKLDWIQSSIDQGNHEAYRIAYNQLADAIKNQKNTLDKVHELLMFEPD